MLIALITSFFISLFSSPMPGDQFIKETRDSVKESIIKSDHRKEVLFLVDEMERELKDFNKQLNKSGKMLTKLNKNHSSSREDFEKLLDELNDKRITSQKNILEIRFGMKDRMKRQEWKAVFDTMSSQEKE